MGSRALTMTPADILRYQNELVRTKKCEPLGRMQKIAIAPAEGWNPPADDPYIAKFGRLIDLRDRFLPIAQSPDKTMVLVMATLKGIDGRVGLPPVPAPDWTPAAATREELEGQEITLSVAESKASEAQLSGDLRTAAQWKAAAENVRAGHPVRMPYERAIEKDTARMIPQRLEDRADHRLEGNNDVLVFSPVINIAFQPEIERRLVGTAWTIRFDYNPADGTHATLLVNQVTGETHFYGGRYDIFGPSGE